jgi:hypothetical protein
MYVFDEAVFVSAALDVDLQLHSMNIEGRGW